MGPRSTVVPLMDTLFTGEISENVPGRKDIEAADELRRFELFVSKLKDLDTDEPQQYEGNALFLHYKLGHLKGSSFEIMSPDLNGLYREVQDYASSTTFYMNPIDCERQCLLLESRLVNATGNSVNITYKNEQTPQSPTTLSYPYPPDILEKEHPAHFTLSKDDLVRGFKSIRREVNAKIIQPITAATGYKWHYSRSTYKDKVYFMYFSCFQDSRADMRPSKFKHFSQQQLEVFQLQPCESSLLVGLNIFTKKVIIYYSHKRHRKLFDIACSFLTEMYETGSFLVS